MKIGKVLVVLLVLIVVMVFVSAGKGFATEEGNWRFSIQTYLFGLSIDRVPVLVAQPE